METPNDGGPAFPAEGGPDSGLHANPGMSLRDWFAGQALAGMTGGGWRPGTDEARETLARDAYKAADAMLAARSREGSR